MSIVMDKAEEIRSNEEYWKKRIANVNSLEDLSEELGVNRGMVGHIFRELGWYREEVIRFKQQYQYNPIEEDSEYKWYVYGFILGDGSLKKDSNSNIVISNSDKKIVDRLSEILEARVSYGRGYSEEEKELGYSGNHRLNYSVNINNFRLRFCLEEFGIVPQKSKVGCMIGEVPKQYVFHFLRGLFDSDGSVHTIKSKRQQNNIIWFMGHPSYMEQVARILEEYVPVKIYRRGTLMDVAVLGRQPFIVMRRLMYEGASIYIESKREKFYNVEFEDKDYKEGIEEEEKRRYWYKTFDISKLENHYIYGKLLMMSNITKRGVEVRSRSVNTLKEVKENLGVNTRIDNRGGVYRFGIRSYELEDKLRSVDLGVIDEEFLRGYLGEAVTIVKDGRLYFRRCKNDYDSVFKILRGEYSVKLSECLPHVVFEESSKSVVLGLMEGLV